MDETEFKDAEADLLDLVTEYQRYEDIAKEGEIEVDDEEEFIEWRVLSSPWYNKF